MTEVAISLKGVHKSFGPIEVIRGVDLEIPKGQRHAIIGPNGAGKTTLFNLISGRFGLSSGTITVSGSTIDGLPAHTSTGWACQRSFSYLDLPRMTVFENMRCASRGRAAITIQYGICSGREKALNEAAERLLEQLSLQDSAQPARRPLSTPNSALGIGITIGGGAEVILLDEPTAGMSHSETDRAVELIRSMTEGKTLVMVEHDMSVVFGLADVISVVVYGELIASDRPERIRANKAVQEAYLGTEAA